jgi:hypothetical protein
MASILVQTALEHRNELKLLLHLRRRHSEPSPLTTVPGVR